MSDQWHSLIGKTAPSITLKNYDGQDYTYTPGESGLPTALFFYPESGTYGCTREACQFRDAIATKDTFKPGKVQIIGISPDPVEKQKAFVEKHKLTYPVLSDVDKVAFKAYGVGKAMFGLIPSARVTFIVDKKGIVRDALDATLNYSAHSKFVDKWLDKLQAEEPKESKEAPKKEEAAAATPAPTSAEPQPTKTDAPVPTPAPAPTTTEGQAPTETPAPASAPTSAPTESSTSAAPAPTETATAPVPEPAAAPAPAPEPAPEQAEASTAGQPAPPEPATAPIAEAE
ncbi:hypothetical protein CVT26_000797 [Gymnopilus dilepis]|uniref:thioredoxin-dependent peroxiredoxin n=1 Tax=Gymnopilus dilepis TaxID=231916 RepID=A0A409VHY0_9AGAR|nr:hypothetical protein CVT26_000797 [Gymnopilus dilepis]